MQPKRSHTKAVLLALTISSAHAVAGLIQALRIVGDCAISRECTTLVMLPVSLMAAALLNPKTLRPLLNTRPSATASSHLTRILSFSVNSEYFHIKQVSQSVS